jgi:hypothetical protein
MSQLSLYLQNKFLSKIEIEAKKENQSISTWAREKLEESLKPKKWSNDFINLFGAIQDSSFNKPKKINFKQDSKRESF